MLVFRKGTIRAGQVSNNNATYFDSFGVAHIPKEVLKNHRKENFVINIYRIQVFHLIMYGYFCSRFNDFILKGESLLDYAN